MKKSAQTKEILNEWRKFEFKQLNESQGSSARVKAKPSARARWLLQLLENSFGVGPFYDYSNFDQHDDDEMIADYGHGPEGIQVEYQEVADFVNSTGEIDISDMKLEDFITAEDDLFYDSGIHSSSLNIVKCGIANLPSALHAEFGYVELVDGERIPVVYSSSHGYTVYRFIPTEYDAQTQPAKTYQGMGPGQGGYWG